LSQRRSAASGNGCLSAAAERSFRLFYPQLLSVNLIEAVRQVEVPVFLGYSLEMLISLSVMNSSSAGRPSSVAAIPRLSAPTISPGSVIRSP
jgi:hypothetical protein